MNTLHHHISWSELERPGVAVLGSTGSVGTQTLDVIRFHQDQFDVVALAAGHNVELLGQQCREFAPSLVVTSEPTNLHQSISGPEIASGHEGLVQAATHPDVDIVVIATSGHTGVAAALAAARAGKVIALANKETIVCAGALLFPLAKQHDADIRPIDSEHSAIWQALGSSQADLDRIILTASGGPFRTLPPEAFEHISIEDALDHPTWNMGGKITIDSATMMNKGLEILEAHWLFGIDVERIDVLIHPQSIVHSLVAFKDGSQRAQLGWPDMRQPIQFALTYPRHVPGPCKSLDLTQTGDLTFHPVDHTRFPAVNLARHVGEQGDSYPIVMSAADDIAVEAFLAHRIGFTEIVPVIQAILDQHTSRAVLSLDDITEVDTWSRAQARTLVERRPTS